MRESDGLLLTSLSYFVSFAWKLFSFRPHSISRCGVTNCHSWSKILGNVPFES